MARVFIRLWGAVLATFAWVGVLHAAPVAGIDCGCSATGNYVLPRPLVETEPANALTTLSPGGKFVVEAQPVTPLPAPSESSHVTIRRAATSQIVLDGLQGVSWGFSPDDDRFVLYSREAGITYAHLFNLASSTPVNALISHFNVSVAGLIAFSPRGEHAIAMNLSPAVANQLELWVVDSETGATRHQRTLPIYTPGVLTHELPEGQVEMQSIRVGFGPDASDRSFVYAWIDTLAQVHWSLVDLASPSARVLDLGGSSYGFDWGFSPCGDRLAIVTDNTITQQKEPRLYSTLDHREVGTAVTYSIADDDFLTVNATEHRAHHGLGPTVVRLAANDAGDACATEPPVLPDADFSVSSPRISGKFVDFTNESSTPSGSLTAYAWSFGDGQTSTQSNPSHVYAAGGSYVVTLTVTNSFGRTDTATQTLSVAANQPPVVSFTTNPAAPNSRDRVTFTSTSTDDDGIVSTYWYINGLQLEGPVVVAKVCGPTTSVQMQVTDSSSVTAMLDVELPVGGSNRMEVPVGTYLNDAINDACPGDTLVLGAGTYSGGVILRDVHLEGSGPGSTVIDGAGEGGWVLSIDSYILPETKVSGLTVRGGVAVFDPWGNVDGGGIRVGFDSAITLDRVEVAHNRGRAGVYVYNNGDDLTFRRSSAHHNEGAGLAVNVGVGRLSESSFYANRVGATFAEGGGSVDDCDFYDNEGSGLNLSDADVSVFRSRFFGNGTSGFGPALRANDSGAWIAGCLVAQNHASGIDIDRGGRIVASTIAGNCGTGLRSEGGRLYDSIVFGNGVDHDGALDVSSTNLIGVDPGFVGGGDYHLIANSPAIDQGDSAHLPSELGFDGDGDARVLAGTGSTAVLDIGWDEWRAGQPADALPVLACQPPTGGSGGAGGTAGIGGSAGISGSVGIGGHAGTAGAASGGTLGDAGAASGDSGASAGGESGASSAGQGGTVGTGAAGGKPGAGGGAAAGGRDDGGAAGEAGGEAGAVSVSGSGGSTGGTRASGGRSSGGSAGRGGGAGNGSAGVPSNQDDDSDDGCGCRVPGGTPERGAPVELAFGMLGLLLLRRVRGSAQRTPQRS